MQKKRWFCPLFDVLGIVSLIGAVIALSGAVGFVDVVPESLVFRIFHVCLAVAVTSLLIGRLAELVNVISENRDPRRLRARSAADTTGDPLMAVASDGDDETDSKFPRAA